LLFSSSPPQIGKLCTRPLIFTSKHWKRRLEPFHEPLERGKPLSDYGSIPSWLSSHASGAIGIPSSPLAKCHFLVAILVSRINCKTDVRLSFSWKIVLEGRFPFRHTGRALEYSVHERIRCSAVSNVPHRQRSESVLPVLFVFFKTLYSSYIAYDRPGLTPGHFLVFYLCSRVGLLPYDPARRPAFIKAPRLLGSLPSY